MLHMMVPYTKLQTFMVTKIQVMIFWVMMLCSDVGYQCFRRLHPDDGESTAF